MHNLLNLPEIDQEQAQTLCKFFIQTHQNIFLFGQKGTGKTQISIQSALDCNYKVGYINLSTLERPDLGGMPKVFDDSEVVNYKLPSFLPPLKAHAIPDQVLLFDEVDKCPSEVANPLLELLQFRKINGQPINVAACILTGNLPNEGAFSNVISTALLDRGAKYILSFDFSKWIEWAKNNNVHDLILGFLSSNQEFACAKTEDTRYASPSPRGWVLASEALIKAKEFRLLDANSIYNLVAGYVGNEAALRFKLWYEHYRKFEPYVHSLIESGGMVFDFASLTPTEQLVFTIAACYFAKQRVLQEIKKPKYKFMHLENLCNFLNKYKVEKEMQLLGLNNSFNFDMLTKYKLYTCKNFFELFKNLNQQ